MTEAANRIIDELLMCARKQSPLTQIAARIPSLKGKTRSIAQFLIQDIARLSNMTIDEIAAECETSRATIMRASNELGYRNFTHLRASLLGIDDQAGVANNELAGEPKPATDVAYETMAQCITMLLDTFSTIKYDRIAEAAQLMVAHTPISVYGGALSGGIARVIQNRLRFIGLTAYASSDVEAISSEMRHGSGLLFCVSHLAGTPNIFRVLRDARRSHVPSILLTNLEDAPACSEADLVLTTSLTSLPTDGYNILARTSELYIIELLSRAIADALKGAESR
jgi:DNA-binding MurR/RpiR family transcriptional regulator